MRRFMTIALAVAMPALAFAGPWAAAGRCPSALVGTVQRCAVKGEDGATFTDCLRFAGPGPASPKLQMGSDLLSRTLGCSCKPAGTAARPNFGAGAAFSCASALGVSFEGRVAKDGTVQRGVAVNDQGGSYVLSCQLDAACAAVAP
jgi:hypothetical protein